MKRPRQPEDQLSRWKTKRRSSVLSITKMTIGSGRYTIQIMKILLVDDDTFLRDMYATKFIECGHEVVSAENGVDALRILETDQSFDLMLVDMIMPGLTGVELMGKLQEAMPDLKTKYIVLSNQGQDQDIDEATTVGAIGYIVKAQSVPSEVVKRVEALMGKQT